MTNTTLTGPCQYVVYASPKGESFRFDALTRVDCPNPAIRTVEATGSRYPRLNRLLDVCDTCAGYVKMQNTVNALIADGSV